MGAFLQKLKRSRREMLLRILGWCNCALMAAVLLAGLTELMVSLELTSLPPDTVYLRGLLFAVPAGLSYLAKTKLPALWRYLLATAGIVALSYFLLGNIGGAVLAFILCFFRLMIQVAAEDEDVSVTIFDKAHFACLIFFGIAFFISAAGGMPVLQRASVISAVFSLLMSIVYSGVQRVDGYLRLNHSISNLPTRRIERAATGAVLVMVALVGVLLLPPAFGMSGDIRIDVSGRQHSAGYVTPEIEVTDPAGVAEAMDQMYSTPFQLPQWIYHILSGLAVIVVAAAAVYAVYCISRRFRSSYRDNQDVVQHLDRDVAEDSPGEKRKKRERTRLFDRSPNALIRRHYRKRVLQAAKERPKQWQTPAELEAAAGISNEDLHRLYEKARYSGLPCTMDDVRKARDSSKG